MADIHSVGGGKPMILVVGAGPAGLATAYYLQRRGLPYQVIDKGGVGYAWQNHYDSLHIHTPKEVSALPGLSMPDTYPTFPSRVQFLSYLQDYAHHFQLNIELGVEVKRATFQDGRWHVETKQGQQQTDTLPVDTLIMATGICSTPHWPIFGGEERFGGRILHAKDYRNPFPFAGQRVLVIGAGNTGAELAVELSQHKVKTGIAIRSGAFFVPKIESATILETAAWFFRHVPPWLGNWLLSRVRPDFSHLGIPPHPDRPVKTFPVVGYELPEAVEAGQVTVHRGVDCFFPGGIRFNDGVEQPFDTVILATGYRPTIQFVEPRLELDEWGNPKGDHPPNLYCVGFHYPGTEGWLQAIDRVAATVVAQLQ
jgi:cation diffusion facilitator CzcD-associated flavoprotein CzcO